MNFFCYGTKTAIRKDFVYKIACEETRRPAGWPEGQIIYSIAFYLIHESKIVVWSFDDDLTLRNNVFYGLMGEE